MAVVDTFGSWVENRLEKRGGDSARSLLLTGYALQKWMLKHHPDKRLPKSKQYLAWLLMDYMNAVISRPEESAMASLFVPCEPLIAAGLKPFSVEGLSAWMTGTRCESALLDSFDGDRGLCSYHRIFLGASKSGLLPHPRFMIYTNLACDANSISFPYLSHQYDIPRFFIEIPYETDEESIRFVAEQLKEMVVFIEDQSHRKVTDEKLREALVRTQKSGELYAKYLALAGERYLPGDITSQMYEVMLSHNMLGSEECVNYLKLALDDYSKAPVSKGLKIQWIHTIPFSQKPVRELLNFNDRVHISAMEMSYDTMHFPVDPDDPYMSMARRVVCNGFNGGMERRVDDALRIARQVKPDGMVFFNHWGCKMTLGGSALFKQEVEKAGIPVLLLDGDGCDMRQQSDGQTATRLGAFFEMLEASR